MNLLRISIENPGELRLAGDLDLSNVDDASAAFSAIEGPLRLDLSELTFIDSMGIALLAMRMSISPVLLVQASPRVHQTLSRMGLTVSPGGELQFA